MTDIYQMEKTFEGLIGYTVERIEELLTSIKIVAINGASAERNYTIREGDKATIAVEILKKKNVFIEK